MNSITRSGSFRCHLAYSRASARAAVEFILGDATQLQEPLICQDTARYLCVSLLRPPSWILLLSHQLLSVATLLYVACISLAAFLFKGKWSDWQETEKLYKTEMREVSAGMLSRQGFKNRQKSHSREWLSLIPWFSFSVLSLSSTRSGSGCYQSQGANAFIYLSEDSWSSRAQRGLM